MKNKPTQKTIKKQNTGFIGPCCSQMYLIDIVPDVTRNAELHQKFIKESNAFLIHPILIRSRFANGLPKIKLWIDTDILCDCYLLAVLNRYNCRICQTQSKPDLFSKKYKGAMYWWVLPVKRCDGQAFERNETKSVYVVTYKMQFPDNFTQEDICEFCRPSYHPPIINKKSNSNYFAEYINKGSFPIYDYIASPVCAETQKEVIRTFCSNKSYLPSAIEQLQAQLQTPVNIKPDEPPKGKIKVKSFPHTPISVLSMIFPPLMIKSPSPQSCINVEPGVSTLPIKSASQMIVLPAGILNERLLKTVNS